MKMEEGRWKMEEKKCREGDTSRGQGFLFWKKGSQVAPAGLNLTHICFTSLILFTLLTSKE